MTRSRVNADNSRSNTRSFASTSEPSTFVDGSIWVDTDGVAASIQRLRWKRTPAAGTTLFTGNNDEGNFSLVYTPNYEEVFLNGVLLVRGVDYAATSGTSITLVEATVAGDIVEVFCTPNLAVTDVYTTSQSEARYLSKSLVDAKGDLYVATADNTTARLPVGTNDQVLVADSSATGGVAWKSNASQQAAGKNVVINGAMDYNQRSAGAITTGYICDRWYVISFAGTGTWQRLAIPTGSFSEQVANNAIRITSSSSTNDFCIGQNIEDVTTFAGQTVTLSFWARVSAGTFGWDIAMFNQQFGVGGSATVSTFLDTAGKNVGTSWTKLTFTGTMPSVIGKTIGVNNNIQLRLDPVTTLANGSWVEITQVQLELGSAATSFTRAGGTLGGELQECQRYYVRYTSDTLYGIFASGIVTSTTSSGYILTLPTTMRATPTSSEYSTLGITDLIGINQAITSLAIVATESNNNFVRLDVGSSAGGLTQYRPSFLRSFNSTSGYLAVSAEL
jgi:hypothetical protein